MLVRCKEGCKKKATTNAVLDIDTNDAVCDYCGEVLEHISNYAKGAMKSNGDILKRKKGKSFTFRCSTCGQEVQAVNNNGLISGDGCKKPKECNFNISDYMKRSILLFSSNEELDEKDKNSEEDNY